MFSFTFEFFVIFKGKNQTYIVRQCKKRKINCNWNKEKKYLEFTCENAEPLSFPRKILRTLPDKIDASYK